MRPSIRTPRKGRLRPAPRSAQPGSAAPRPAGAEAARDRYLPVKHAFDFAAAALGLALIWPVMAIIAAGVRLSSPGPVFYRQVRLGRGRRPFLLYKFRSMRVDAEKEGPRWADRCDPRSTRFGAFLRRTHLDELPQLFNVLRGEMSLVGPRPERPVFVHDLQQRLAGYSMRMEVRPGITGLAQINQPPDLSIDDVRIKLAYDLNYLQRCSLRTDMAILAGTVGMLIGLKPPPARPAQAAAGEPWAASAASPEVPAELRGV
jgi:lipopolysaccharide/colanic/teichoic acid biosynthesis glycosyltransferase